MSDTKKEVKTVLLPEGRVINASIFEKDAFKPERGEESTPQYKIELAFDPATIVGQGTIEDELINAVCDEWGDAAEQEFLDGKIISPLLDGNKLAADREARGKAGDAYKGKIVVRSNTIFNKFGQDAPGGIAVFGPDVKEIGAANQNEIYPGMYAQVAVVISPYLIRGQKGVKCYLQAVQKTRDGDKLSSPRDYTTVFKPVGGVAGATAAAAGGRRTRRA